MKKLQTLKNKINIKIMNIENRKKHTLKNKTNI